MPSAGDTRILSGILIIQCDLPEAVVWVDERRIGEVGMLAAGIRVAAGAHRVEVRHDDRFPRFLDVTVASGEKRLVPVTLAEVLD